MPAAIMNSETLPAYLTTVPGVSLQPHIKFVKHSVSSLSLFVFWILADYPDASFSLDNFAFFANRLYG